MEREMHGRVGWLGRESLSDDERRHALAHELGLPFVTLEPREISLEALVLIPEPLAREHNALGYRLQGHDLEVLLLDLSDLDALRFLESRYRLLPRLTTRTAMVKGLLHYQRHLRERYGAALEAADSPNLLDTLMRHALASGATDVHLERSERGMLVRYRIRGSLKEAFSLPAAVAGSIANKLRSLAGLGSSGMLPRESRLRVDLGSGEDLRLAVASMPTVGGEKIVLHLLRERARRGWTLSALGLHGEALERVYHVLNRRRGIITVAGPTGAGKTTMLYTLLDLLNSPEVALASVEARVEQVLLRAAQVEVGALLSPAAALRGVLKTDPDVLMLDPAEGREVVTLAQAAASRGVLVLAGTQELELIERAELSITVAVVRKLCDKKFLDKRKLTRQESDALEAAGADFAKVLAALKEEEKVDKDLLWKDMQFARQAGCSECEGGYLGRLGLQEVAHKGELVGLTIVEDALFKAAQGLTSIEEVLTLARYG